MLIKLTLALIGGTVLSLIFGYLIAYWRDIGRDSLKSSDDSSWSILFDTLTRLKTERFKHSERQRAQKSDARNSHTKSQHKRRSRAPSSWEKHSEIERLLLRFEDFHPRLYSYFLKIKDSGEELMKLEASELEKRLGIRVSASMMADRIHELLELKAFESLSLQDSGPEAVHELWLSHTVAQIYLDDARLGSTTLSQSLCKELSLDSATVFRGIEAQFMLVKGASKKVLFRKYWKEHQKSSFERSSYLQNLTPTQRAELAYKWARTKMNFAGMIQQLRETLLEIERFFEGFYRDQNSGKNNQNKQKNKKTKQQRTTQETQKDPLQWAYELLEMTPSQEFITIKKQFKKMAMKYHPDRLVQEGLSELECKRHHEHFVEIQKAYKALEKHYDPKAA
jgi:DnaJ-domain-containing protein 1